MSYQTIPTLRGNDRWADQGWHGHVAGDLTRETLHLRGFKYESREPRESYTKYSLDKVSAPLMADASGKCLDVPSQADSSALV